MYKLEVTLKQHTPLIHFQHDQEGATLRASEVKPKLDRFIRTDLCEIYPKIFEEYKQFIDLIPDSSGGQNKISPYKLSIKTIGLDDPDKYVIASYIPKRKIDEYQSKGYKVLSQTSYFADNKLIGENDFEFEKVRLGVMLKKNTNLLLTLRFNDPMWEDMHEVFLQKIIPSFFALNNFGSRQNKGFGSFYPKDLDEQSFMESFRKKRYPYLYYKEIKDGNLIFIFKEINTLYNSLKSGGQRGYSELRKYFNNQRPMIDWEKPAIQKEVAGISGQQIRIDSKTDKQEFVRALLGLSELYEYPRQDSIKAKVNNVNGIERYPSPILFKVFGNTIFVTINPSQIDAEVILDKKFQFEFINKGKNYGKRLELPTPEEFDILDFFEKAMSYQKSWTEL